LAAQEPQIEGGFIMSPTDPNRYRSHLPAPATPRLPDGKVNFGRTEPGRGNWLPRQIFSYERVLSKGQDTIPYQPWAKAMRDYREFVSLQADDPEGFCLPPGGPRLMTTFFSMEIIQLPDRIIEIFEGGSHVWRIIYMDGRPHPSADELKQFPTWLGHSIGRWEGDTLLIDTVGYNEGTWVDSLGTPHTSQMHLIERLSRPNLMTLHYEATIDDPGAYTKPWTIDWDIPWVPDKEIKEYICQENNRWQENWIIANKMGGGTGNVGADSGQGHPATGTWMGDWGTNMQRRNDVLMLLNWDGKTISGTLNPGGEEVALTGSLDHTRWTMRLEGKSPAGIPVVIDGKIENLGWANRGFVGTWTQGNTKGDFRIKRQR
jgi:hypothetical protein